MPLTSSFFEFFKYLPKRRQRQSWLLLLLMLIGAFAELLSLGAILPFLAIMANPAKAFDYPKLQQLFTQLGWNDPQQLLLPVTVLFVAASLLAGAIRLFLAWVSNKFVFTIGYDVSVAVYERTLYQPYSFHVSRNTSDILAGINKVQLVVTGVLVPLMTGIISLILSVFILMALLYIDPVTASAAGVGFTAIYLGVTVSMRRQLRRNGQIISKAQTARIQCVQEGLGGIRDVLLDGTQPLYLDRFKKVDAPLRHAQATNTFVGVAPRYLIEAIGMALIAVLAFGLSGKSGGLQSALPVLGALALGAQKLMPLMQQAYNGWTRVSGNRAMLLDVLELLRLPVQPQLAKGEPVAFEREIALRDLGFGYSAQHDLVLKGLNLVIPKGSKVGFIGKTGSGKSTAMDIVMGLLTASEGKLCVDDVPISAHNQQQWQKHIAHVPQAIYLSDASIAENIAFGVHAHEIDPVRLRKAAQQAQIGQFIEGLPKGYDTDVGERGVRLSGGQRQRIGIARALYKQVDVLVLDEATSALDSDTESAVMDCIESLGKDLTVLMIAHRLSTLKVCDLVVRLEQGRIVAAGSYSDMVADNRWPSR
ncbi:MAG: ABC transporter ATP-binding protein [Pseudomonadota bacterium]